MDGLWGEPKRATKGKEIYRKGRTLLGEDPVEGMPRDNWRGRKRKQNERGRHLARRSLSTKTSEKRGPRGGLRKGTVAGIVLKTKRGGLKMNARRLNGKLKGPSFFPQMRKTNDKGVMKEFRVEEFKGGDNPEGLRSRRVQGGRFQKGSKVKNVRGDWANQLTAGI